MSELAVIDNNNYAAMAQMMGMAYDAGDTKNKSTLARIKVQKKAIKGKAEVNGKNVTVDVVTAGSFIIEKDGKDVYAESINMRIHVQRFMYQKYDNAVNNYMKTVMSPDLEVDLKDNYGTFNCGKPSGYIQDFSSLPDAMQELIRSIKRTRVILGTVTFVDATDEKGNTVEVVDMPFVWEVDNKEGFKNFAAATAKLAQHRRLSVYHNINVTTAEREAVGNTYYVPICEVDLDNTFEVLEKDQALFKDFMAWIESHNRWVLSEWDQKQIQKATDEEKELAESFVDIDVEEVE